MQNQFTSLECLLQNLDALAVECRPESWLFDSSRAAPGPDRTHQDDYSDSSSIDIPWVDDSPPASTPPESSSPTISFGSSSPNRLSPIWEDSNSD